jgi:hypothetical protein
LIDKTGVRSGIARIVGGDRDPVAWLSLRREDVGIERGENDRSPVNA